MNKKSALVMVLIISLLCLVSACDRMKKVHNEQVHKLVEDIKAFDHVSKVSVGNRAFDLIINIYVDEDFMLEENSSKILNLAKEYLKADVVNDLKAEFEQDSMPDTEIYIRNEDGQILIDFLGTCYESYDRNVLPKYSEYQWIEYKWEAATGHK